MAKKRKSARYVLFWIKSGRGTDEKSAFEIPNDWTKDNIQTALEKWCSGFTAWNIEFNIITYGWKPIKVPNRKELEKKYHLVCKNKDKITERWKVLFAMLNIRKFK